MASFWFLMQLLLMLVCVTMKNNEGYEELKRKRSFEEETCTVCYYDYDEGEHVKVKTNCKPIDHISCANCYYVCWYIHGNRVCWMCRKKLMHPLKAAVKFNNLPFIKTLIEIKKIDIHEKLNRSKRPILFQAVKYKNFELVKYFLENGASVNCFDRNFVTPLHVATCKNNLQIVKILIKNGAKINYPTKRCHTFPLYIALEKKFYELAIFLIKKGADVNQTDIFGITPIWLVSKYGSLKMIEFLVKNGASVPNSEYIRNPFLAIPASKNYFDIIQFLIEKGAHSNQMGFGRSRTLLYFSSQEGNFKISRFLIDQGADVNARTSFGTSPLSAACAQGHEKIVELLLKNGAKINQLDNMKNSPALLALLLKKFHVFKILAKEKEINFDVKNIYGMTLLWLATRKNHFKITKFLIKKGCEVNIQSNDGKTPLFLASGYGYVNVVKLLLKNGANVNISDTENGDTPILIAVKKNQISIIKILIRENDEINLLRKNLQGETAIFIASKMNHHEILKIFFKKLGHHNEFQIALQNAIMHGFLEITNFLLDRGILVENGTDLMASAIKNGQVEMCELLIEHQVIDLNSIGMAPLWTAAQCGNLELVELFLKNDENGVLAKKVNECGRGPLWIATLKGYKKIMEILIQAGASASQMDIHRITPIHLAAALDYHDMLKIFLKEGGGVGGINEKDKYGRTPLFLASLRGNFDSVLTLLDHGADPTIAHNEGLTPKEIAEERGHSSIVLILSLLVL